MARELPACARIDRSLPHGVHPFLRVLPDAAGSPALTRIAPDAGTRELLLSAARVQIRDGSGYAFIDVDVPCIVLSGWYLRDGSDLDLYLDLLHELTHLRQLEEGHDLWDERFAYVDRPTEIEGYAVAIEEGRRLGMSDEEVLEHLSNPWMTAADITRLIEHVQRFLDSGVLPNRDGSPPPKGARSSRRPW